VTCAALTLLAVALLAGYPGATGNVQLGAGQTAVLAVGLALVTAACASWIVTTEESWRPVLAFGGVLVSCSALGPTGWSWGDASGLSAKEVSLIVLGLAPILGALPQVLTHCSICSASPLLCSST
jgi:hypothetical protein